MSLQACAEMVERSDPDRFRVAMAAPPPAREILFPLYAFNLEVARAPWRTREPMLAEMRLQWWRDVVENSAAGETPPAHEVAGPLGALLNAGRLDPAPLDALIEARRRDIEREPFAPDALRPYLEGTAGNLLWAGAGGLGEPESSRPAIIQAGYASGLATWLLALPELATHGRGLAILTPDTIHSLAQDALAALSESRRTRFGPGIPALRAASLAAAMLKAASRDPDAVLHGRLALPEGQKRLRLLWVTLRGTW
ncbi:Phytoene/squalene synthetase-like protein [Rubellimicrobium mesophilum DSM 19309]|uniref:Phytoene/squalene synthetase-like protein n=1 Tax=Rubellimicrobium mesophilum DSM 19309 TaxID=442562 RepID=A0A017HSL1_9RHOB|nr:squalene/phytoene synthase family protein [Rubellimicrobium mesophilum]EYD76744.1 Phytoene/squalene synthetase-like protein [Rubellimicrobium mesophilum DSM 19309]